MQHKNIYEHIASNNIKTFLLMLAMPVLLVTTIYIVLRLALINDPESVRVTAHLMKTVVAPMGGVALGWGIISYFWGDKMMLGFAGAELAPDNKETQHIYRAVENTALAAGLPTPKIYLIQDESLNAFATGHSPKTASIAITTGLANKLNPLELQAVIAHELGHIGNRDIRLNMIIITGIGICAMLADLIFRMAASSGNSRNKDAGQAKVALIVLGIALLIFNFIVAPIIQMAISRTREYAADATAAFITRNPLALASALRKISQDARVEALDGAKTMSHACIFDPTDKAGQTSAFFGWDSTHPPIEKRIERLEQMSGLF